MIIVHHARHLFPSLSIPQPSSRGTKKIKSKELKEKIRVIASLYISGTNEIDSSNYVKQSDRGSLPIIPECKFEAAKSLYAANEATDLSCSRH